MQLKDLVEPLAVVVQTLKHHLFVFVGNHNAGNPGGRVDHVFGDDRLVLCLRPQRSGQQCAAQASRRKNFHERASLQHCGSLPEK